MSLCPSPRICNRLRRREAHPLVHGVERRLRGGACLVGSLGEKPLELDGIRAQLAVAFLDRLDERDDRLADLELELPVALAVEAGLDRLRRLARRDRHDVDQVSYP